MTEAFAWLLNIEPDFSIYMLETLLPTPPLEQAGSLGDAEWATQENWNGCFPDMVCMVQNKDHVLVFEHKIWSSIHSNQIQNYRKYAEANYKNSTIFLITASRHQWNGHADIQMCWSDVYTYIKRFTEKTSSSYNFLFLDFLELLAANGLAPIGNFTTHEIVGYSSDFRERLHRFWEAVAHEIHYQKRELFAAVIDKLESQSDFYINKGPEDSGRIGISLFNEWRPSLFIGVILDTYDNGITYSKPELGPDLCFMLSFDAAFHERYEGREFKNLVSQLQHAFSGGPGGWRFYNHNDAATTKEIENLWHPLFLRRPFLEVLSLGGADGELKEQASRIIPLLVDPLMNLFTKTDFLDYRNSSEHKSVVNLTNFNVRDRVFGSILNSSFYKIESVDSFTYYSTPCIATKFTLDKKNISMNIEFYNEYVRLYIFSDSEIDPVIQQYLMFRNCFECFEKTGNHYIYDIAIGPKDGDLSVLKFFNLFWGCPAT